MIFNPLQSDPEFQRGAADFSLVMSRFTRRLRELEGDPEGRRWCYVPYDQLNDGIGLLAREDPGTVGMVFVESPWKAARRPYHQQKLALILANGRHFVLEQARRGVAVRYVVARGPFCEALEPVIAELGALEVMRPAERELRADLKPLVARGGLKEIPHEGWLSTAEDFRASQRSGPPWRMDAFYRRLRQGSGILMRDGKPEGGRYSFDADNRKPWPGEPPAPQAPSFGPDEITLEVAELIGRHFRHHPGFVDLSTLPATAEDAERLWSWARKHCLAFFGPYEDAMSRRSRGLFHTRISGLLNLHRLLPSRVVRDAAELDLPLASKEGFVRQVLGWREFVHQVHERTDGFRCLPSADDPPRADHPGDAGFARWHGDAWPAEHGANQPDGGAEPSALGAAQKLPLAYWPGHPSGLACLDRVVEEVWSTAWTHHIPRLMVLANFATLLDTSARELCDWFWVAFSDAFDWVVEPNVLAMGTFAVGPLMTTKPYVSGAAYINRMSDDCSGCQFEPKTTCPITPLYWAFLERQRAALADNPRMRLALSSAAKRSPDRRAQDRAIFERVSRFLSKGLSLRPKELEEGQST